MGKQFGVPWENCYSHKIITEEMENHFKAHSKA